MGYTHYWYRPREIQEQTFLKIKHDFLKLVLPLQKAGVTLAGPWGVAAPVIRNDVIAFNGPIDCGHSPGYELSIPWPAPEAGGVFAQDDPVVGTWPAGNLVITRTCDGDCSYESFVFERSYTPHHWEEPDEEGRFFSSCKTAFRPYDLAVTAFLLIAKRHLKDSIQVATDGEDAHWFDARLLCHMELGYGLSFAVKNGYLLENTRKRGNAGWISTN